MEILLHAKVVITSNYKKNLIQSNLIIKNRFQSFKAFVQMIKQFFCTLLLKTNVIFFFDISTMNFLTFERFI